MSEQVFVQLPSGLLGEGSLVFIFSAVTAVVGAFVAYQAYRGYKRNDSRSMLFLAAGIVLLTGIPFVASYTVQALTATSDAGILLIITVANVAGIAAILYAVTDGSRTQ